MAESSTQAIAYSISHGTIARVPYDGQLLADLIAASDSYTRTNDDGADVWGIRDGQKWRVIMSGPDFSLRSDDSIALLFPSSDPAHMWISENLDADVMVWGSAVVIEHRYVEAVIRGIVGDGLTVMMI